MADFTIKDGPGPVGFWRVLGSTCFNEEGNPGAGDNITGGATAGDFTIDQDVSAITYGVLDFEHYTGEATWDVATVGEFEMYAATFKMNGTWTNNTTGEDHEPVALYPTTAFIKYNTNPGLVVNDDQDAAVDCTGQDVELTCNGNGYFGFYGGNGDITPLDNQRWQVVAISVGGVVTDPTKTWSITEARDWNGNGGTAIPVIVEAGASLGLLGAIFYATAISGAGTVTGTGGTLALTPGANDFFDLPAGVAAGVATTITLPSDLSDSGTINSAGAVTSASADNYTLTQSAPFTAATTNVSATINGKKTGLKLEGSGHDLGIVNIGATGKGGGLDLGEAGTVKVKRVLRATSSAGNTLRWGGYIINQSTGVDATQTFNMTDIAPTVAKSGATHMVGGWIRNATAAPGGAGDPDAIMWLHEVQTLGDPCHPNYRLNATPYPGSGMLMGAGY